MLTILISWKWVQLSIHTVKSTRIDIWTVFIFNYVGYFDRYKSVKLLQIQTSGDEFFLPDNEVRGWPWS